MIELLKNQKLKGQFRHALTFFGGIAVGKGLIGEDALNAILGNFDAIVGGIGAVATVVGAVMSWKSKKDAPSNGTPIAPMVALGGCLLIAGAAGCASTQTGSRPTPERDARLVRMTAMWSVYASTQQEPKSRVWFEAADVVLGAALNDGDLDPAKLRATLLAIPVKELKSDFAFLAIAAGFDLYNELWAEKWADREEGNTRIFLEAFQEGIRLGLAMRAETSDQKP